MSRLKIGSVLALVIGPFILVMNYLETSKNQKIDREGIAVAAEPTAKIEKRGRKGRKSYKVEIEFPLQGGGGKYTTQVNVSHQLYDRIDTIPALQIKYLKEKPSELIVVGEPLTKPEMNYIGIGIFALGAIGTWWYFIRKQPQLASVETPAGEPPPLPPAS
jgi:hypothetical protein